MLVKKKSNRVFIGVWDVWFLYEMRLILAMITIFPLFFFFFHCKNFVEQLKFLYQNSA